MMKFVLLISILTFGVLYAQEVNKIIIDEKLNKEVLIGKCDRDGLESEVFAEYFTQGYKKYSPDKMVIKKLKKFRKNIEIVIVMASWCSDSKEQIPRFYKIIDKMKLKECNIKLYAVDRGKTGGGVDVSVFDIQRVPTFIFYRDGIELGRIIETPVSTLEEDALMILTSGY